MWCFKNGNLDSIKWERTYDKSVEFEELYVDQSDSLYLLLEDERDYGAIYRLDKNTGATNMVAKTNHRSVELHNVLFTDSFLYATTKYGGVGISVFKFSKADGVTIWSQGHTLAPNGSKATQNWVTSTTVDAQSDLIIAGYHYRVNDLKVCSAIKISGKHGRLLNRATISNYGGQADTKSECRFITENDNKLYMLAHLNYNADFHYARLIRMDTAFNRVAQWDLRSKSPFVSQTLDIQKHNDKMLVFKQKVS